MTNEYLFLNNKDKSSIESYKPDGIVASILDFDNTESWVAQYSLEGETRENAEKLSGVHDKLVKYKPQILTCGSAAYFNKRLFPQVNELERKLRKLLYLAAARSDDEKARESIKQLEEKDFGEIFDFLFIDPEFISSLKKRINADNKGAFNGKSKYSKTEIELYLKSLSESTLWDTILGDKSVPTLRNNFREVQSYRNDVMHAHNISQQSFNSALNTFTDINKELDSAIDGLVKNSDEKYRDSQLNINTAISNAADKLNELNAIDFSSVLSHQYNDDMKIGMEIVKIFKDVQVPEIKYGILKLGQQIADTLFENAKYLYSDSENGSLEDKKILDSPSIEEDVTKIKENDETKPHDKKQEEGLSE